MMKSWLAASALLALGACATSVPYGPAASDGAKGYSVLPIENNRFRITYKDNSMELARSRALRRAAEITLEQGDDWFQIVTAPGAKPDNPDAYNASEVLANLGGA